MNKKQIIFKILNPIEPYTCAVPQWLAPYHPDEAFQFACTAAQIMGPGQYGVESAYAASGIDKPKDEECMPPLLKGSAGSTWYRERFGCGIDDFINDNKGRLAIVLTTIIAGTVEQRIRLIEQNEKIKDHKAARADRIHWHDCHRSKMTDLGRAAWTKAAEMCNKLEQAVEIAE